MSELRRRTGRLVDRRRSILALDTSPGALAARFRAAGVVADPSSTAAYLRMLLETPDLGAAVSGVVLAPASLRSSRGPTGQPAVAAAQVRRAGILVGVRADIGHAAIAGAGHGRVTSGLPGLGSRLGRLRDLGADFAVWSICTPPVDDVHAVQTLTTNSQAAARFAAGCLALGVVPLVRVGTRMPAAPPGRRRMALASALLSIAGHLEDNEVDLSATVAATTCDIDPTQAGAAGPLSTLPPDLGGVALCPAEPVPDAGGDAIAALSSALPPAPPWPLTCYLGREATEPALHAWRGRPGAVPDGQRALRFRLAAATAALTEGRHLHAVPTTVK